MQQDKPFPTFPSPFVMDCSPIAPRTLKELLMCHAMQTVMRKPNWMGKVRDEVLVQKWKEELLACDVPLEFLPAQLDDAAVKYVFDELAWLASSHNGGPVQPSGVDGVFVIPDATEILEEKGALRPFLEAVQRMASVPADEVDYHPGSDGQVIDLVHPSLYPVFYGHTRVISDDLFTSQLAALTLEAGCGGSTAKREGNEAGSSSAAEGDCTAVFSWSRMISSVGDSFAQVPSDLLTAIRATYSSEFISTAYQWLPAEIDVGETSGRGTATGQQGGLLQAPSAKFRSYVNNLNPRVYPALYPALASIFAMCFVPLFNSVLSELANPRPTRLRDDYKFYDDWDGGRRYHSDCDSDSDYDADEEYAQFVENRVPRQPPVPHFEAPPSIPAEAQVDLRGRRLQVIVKIAEIRLTPEKPTYPGGTWHVEGMRNEAIVATGIYYFGVDNIEDSELCFRRPVDEPGYEQNDHRGVQEVYGLEDGKALVQRVGAVSTCTEGMCLAFPNLYHHKVAPFSLNDSSKPGARKLLAFFLVDPGSRILSTARVPPQQASWRRLEMERRLHPCAVLQAPALDLVIARHCEEAGCWDEDTARARREQLMWERRMIVSDGREQILERPFSLCEH